MKDEIKIVAKNKKATFDYFILTKYEAGIELFGTEIKSIRLGNVNLKDSYCEIDNGEMFVLGMHISPYEKGSYFNKEPLRPKKLLMHKKEIMTLLGKVKQDGLTLIPLSLYFKGSKLKLEIGLCKGKKLYDKRDTIAKKESDRQIERQLKERNTY
ncbi:MAG: SsrA-binding protein SmpB [Clostridia bacterium]|nr:SsrA-binding protein SmpB [Clostridia bacterium]